MATSFRVTGQRPSSVITPNSQIQKVIEVSFETIPGQVTGTVDVPLNQYSAAYVKQLIEPLAAEMEATNNL